MKKNYPTVCLLGASFGTSNMGVNALTVGTLTTFFRQFPKGEMFLLDYGKAGSTYNFQIDNMVIPVQLVNIRFSKKFYLKNNIAFLIVLAIIARCIPFSRIRKNIIYGNICLGRINEADFIASLAGGDSFSDIYGLSRFFYVSLPQLLALFLGKRLILLPQTIGPFKHPLVKIIAKTIIKRAEAVYSRDQTGISDASHLLGLNRNNQRVRFCYDVGFALQPVKPVTMDLTGLPERSDRVRPVIGLNVSGLLYMGGYTQSNMFGLKDDYRELVYGLIDHLILTRGTDVLLVPHVFGTKEHDESDSVICEQIYAELKPKYQRRLYMVRGSYNQSEIKYIIGLCDFFIGSRMHACIAALSQNIPAAAIAYSKKFYGVLETIGLESLVADPRKLNEEEMLNIINNA